MSKSEIVKTEVISGEELKKCEIYGSLGNLMVQDGKWVSREGSPVLSSIKYETVSDGRVHTVFVVDNPSKGGVYPGPTYDMRTIGSKDIKEMYDSALKYYDFYKTKTREEVCLSFVQTFYPDNFLSFKKFKDEGDPYSSMHWRIESLIKGGVFELNKQARDLGKEATALDESRLGEIKEAKEQYDKALGAIKSHIAEATRQGKEVSPDQALMNPPEEFQGKTFQDVVKVALDADKKIKAFQIKLVAAQNQAKELQEKFDKTSTGQPIIKDTSKETGNKYSYEHVKDKDGNKTYEKGVLNPELLRTSGNINYTKGLAPTVSSSISGYLRAGQYKELYAELTKSDPKPQHSLTISL